jgi:hypothetical protein
MFTEKSFILSCKRRHPKHKFLVMFHVAASLRDADFASLGETRLRVLPSTYAWVHATGLSDEMLLRVNGVFCIRFFQIRNHLRLRFDHFRHPESLIDGNQFSPNINAGDI